MKARKTGLPRWMAAPDVSAGALISGSRLLQNGLGFLLSLLVLTRFGISALGSLTIASVWVAMQAGLFSFGLQHVLAKLPLSPAGRNTAGFLAAVLATVLCLPASIGLGAAFGHDAGEQVAIAAFAFGGAYFAQTVILDALLVLDGRVWLTYLSPLGAAAGMLLGYVQAQDLPQFALYLTLGRLAGVYALFATLKYEWCGWAQFASSLRDGVRYIVPDLMNLASEHLGTALLGVLATRAELGVFGLCRQFITAAETPLWSRLMALYPAICRDASLTERYAREMSVIGVAIGASAAVLASLLAVAVFHVPGMLALAPLLMCSVPFRYRGGTAESGLRAFGRTAVIHRLAAMRLAWLLAWPLAYGSAGLLGVAVLLVLQNACMSWLALDAFRRSCREVPCR